MSGVFIKMGIYGLVRVMSLVPDAPLWWGSVLLGIGVISGVLGVAFAIGQHDIKRLLAYHSIENIGIIVMGLGLALLGRSLEAYEWVVLGLGGALLHVWNHALFKSLLFFSSGSVIHSAHTREIDQLGGLGKKMPATALCFLIGAVAICGLPPLNGFVSELLIYLGLFRTLGTNSGRSWAAAAFAVPALALIGTLATACFVKVFGAVFLGVGRSEAASKVHEAQATMLGPMGVLVAFCLLIGLAPLAVAPLLEPALFAWSPAVARAWAAVPPPHSPWLLGYVAPLAWLSVTGAVLIILLGAVGVLLWQRLASHPHGSGGTWDCGYAAPSARMQYTSSSFAQMLVELFAWALRPRVHPPKVDDLFPTSSRFHSEVPDTVLADAVLPATRGLAWLASGFRIVQQGSIQAYLVYIFVTLIALLLWPT
jgi:hydrogenase-4 component B